MSRDIGTWSTADWLAFWAVIEQKNKNLQKLQYAATREARKKHLCRGGDEIGADCKDCMDRFYAQTVHHGGCWVIPGTYSGWYDEWMDAGSVTNTYPLTRMLDFVGLTTRPPLPPSPPRPRHPFLVLVPVAIVCMLYAVLLGIIFFA